mgnify:CR=1 FL=1
MLYFKLYDDERLKDLKHSKKIEVVNNAAKIYRKDNPLNVISRLLAVIIWCCIPAIILFFVFVFVFGFSFSVGFFTVSIIILNSKLANDESVDVEAYLNQVLE